MATFAVNGIYRLVSRMKYGTQSTVQNAYHFICSVGGVVAEATIKTATQAWLDAIYDTIYAYITSDIDPFDLKMDRVQWNGATGRFEISENVLFTPWVMANNPSDAAEALPLQTCPIINLRTARPQTVGRRFLPPFCEDVNNSAGQIPAAVLANLNLAGADMLLSLTAGTAVLVPGVPSSYSGTDAHFFRYTSSAAAALYMTQRRRRLTVGA